MHIQKHAASRSLEARGLVLERASFLRLRQRKPGTNRRPGPLLQSHRKRWCCLFLWRVLERGGPAACVFTARDSTEYCTSIWET
ncbi:hypothetical protein XENOCAPTIV_009470 [Xenoophorus captivus]|uniref:Uncharacterized protein n=1 Tax=Xenoophorus captivus TaxID=1517983 RepID=A0ABV0RLU4_9TELE